MCLDGNAIIYCEGAFQTPNGKTAHGLVRRTHRYHVLSVIDSTCAGADAGVLLDGQNKGIPILPSLSQALEAAGASNPTPTHLVMGLAPDGGRLPTAARAVVAQAIIAGLDVDSGLHDFLTDDDELSQLARRHGVWIRDIRKPPPRSKLHFFSGEIEQVEALKVALLGTDSAVGKRTTAWELVAGLQERGVAAAFVGTGQTAWLQGAKHCIALDSLVNDFVAGEIEHAVCSAWHDGNPEVIVIEGQGSLLNPAYPGGFEILAAGRPDLVVLQHAPARLEYDGFPGYPLHSVERQIEAIEVISDRSVVAIAVNHEGLERHEVPAVCEELTRRLGIPAVDVLLDGPGQLVEAVLHHGKLETSPAA